MSASPVANAARILLPDNLTEDEVRALLAHLKATRPEFAIAYWSRMDIEPWLTANRGRVPGDAGYQRLTAEDWQRLNAVTHWGDLDMIAYDRVEEERALPQALTEAGLEATDPTTA